MGNAVNTTPEQGRRSGKWLRPAVLVALVVLLLVAVRFIDVKEHLQAGLAWMQGLGATGLVVLGIAYVFACVLFIPGSLLTMGAGFLASSIWADRPIFAVLMGTITVSFGSVAGATIAFVLGRTLARDWVAEKVRGNAKFEALDNAIGRSGRKMVFLVRLSLIFPFNLLNYALGLTKVSLGDYVLASWIGMIPGTIMYVYFGSAAQNVTALAAGQVGGGPGQQILMLVGLVATIALVVLVTRVTRNALREAIPAQKPQTVEDA